MLNTNSKIAGNSRKFRATFYSGGNYTSANLTTSLAGSNSNIRIEAVEAGILGNDISLSYIDTGLEVTPFKLDVQNDQDIIITLERDCSRAILATKNTDKEANIQFTSSSIGDEGNNISISIVNTDATPAVITSASISSKVVTITTTQAHGFVRGDIVGISGLVGDSLTDLNGCYQIDTVADTTHFTYKLTSSITATTAGGYGIASLLDIVVETSDFIIIKSPISSSGYPMITPKALELGWARFSDALDLVAVLKLGDIGDKPIGFISRTYLSKGKNPAVTTTPLDVKRAIEKDTLTKDLVNVFIPEGTLGTGVLSTLPKTNLSGGSNLIKLDPDDSICNVFIYDEFENVIATSDTEYEAENDEMNIEIINAPEKESIGVYSCTYTPNKKNRSIFVEFKALIDDIVVLSRQRVDLEWAITDTSGATGNI